MRFFRKIGKIAVISIILIKKPNNWVENSEKSDFSLELVGIFAIISTNNYMWIHISKIAKNSYLFHTNKGGNRSQVNFTKTIHNYCRKHRKSAKFVILHNRTQSSEKFSPIVSQSWHFLKVPHQLLYIQSINCSHANFSKQQLTAYTSIVKRYTASVTNTHKSLQSALLLSLVLANLLTSTHKTQYK